MIELTTLNPSPSHNASSPQSSWRDWAGVVASVGCAIHCAAMPLVISYLPLLGLSFLADEAFHRWMALVCFLIAIAAFIPGFRTHKRFLPGAIGIIGLCLITGAAFGTEGDCCVACGANATPSLVTSASACTDACCEHCATSVATTPPIDRSELASNASQMASISPLNVLGPWITPLGGLLLVSAHLLNRRFGCLCGCCGSNADESKTL